MSTLSAWEETTVGDFAPFIYGKSLPERLRNSSGNVTVFGSNGIVGRHDEPLSDGPGIIIGRKGTVGAVHFSPDPFWPIDTTFYVLPNNRRDIRFTYYLLFTLGLESMNSDTAVPGLNRNAAHARAIVVPPLYQQRAIAAILGALDDKIELNRQMNKTLEAIAQALFKTWFVDFEPFRDQGMEESALGLIPQGWLTKPLDEIANFVNGLALQRYPPEDDKYLPVIKIAELRRGVTESSGKASLNIDKMYIVEDGDILFSWSGSLEVCIWCGGRGALNQHLFKVTSENYPRWFYYHWIKHHLPEFQAIAAGKATTMGHIQRYHLSAALVAIPPEDKLEWMDSEMTPILKRIIQNNLESRTLAATRDTLLPKLLSGEIRVKDTEKFVEKAI